MKKLSALIFLLILIPVFCFSQIKISAKAGYLGINIEELLFDKTGEGAQTNSFLDWNTYAAPVIVLDAEYKPTDKLIIGLGGFYTIPFSYGKMEDFDYMNIFSTGTNERTHYSQHDNRVNNYYNINAFFGAGGTFIDKLKLSALFSVDYTFYSFSSYNGFKQYGEKIGTVNGSTKYSPWNADIPKIDMEGKIITFAAQKLYFGIGTRFDFSATDKLNLILKLNFKPVLFGNTLDNHHRRNTPFYYFELSGELAFDSSLLLEYKLQKNSALTAGLDFFVSSAKTGTLYQSRTRDEWVQLANGCGVNQKTYRFLVGYSYIYEK